MLTVTEQLCKIILLCMYIQNILKLLVRYTAHNAKMYLWYVTIVYKMVIYNCIIYIVMNGRDNLICSKFYLIFFHGLPES